MGLLRFPEMHEKPRGTVYAGTVTHYDRRSGPPVDTTGDDRDAPLRLHSERVAILRKVKPGHPAQDHMGRRRGQDSQAGADMTSLTPVGLSQLQARRMGPERHKVGVSVTMAVALSATSHGCSSNTILQA